MLPAGRSSLARRAFARGQADTLLDAAAMLDELADELNDAVERFGAEKVAGHFRLMSGRVRANASQLRSRSAQEPRDGPDG